MFRDDIVAAVVSDSELLYSIERQCRDLGEELNICFPDLEARRFGILLGDGLGQSQGKIAIRAIKRASPYLGKWVNELAGWMIDCGSIGGKCINKFLHANDAFV